MVVEEIARRYKIVLTENKGGYSIGRGSVEGHKVFLSEPLLFMNMSGPVVHRVAKKLSVTAENLIVIHDDLDMETGKLRLRKTGSSGGHKVIRVNHPSTGQSPAPLPMP